MSFCKIPRFIYGMIYVMTVIARSNQSMHSKDSTYTHSNASLLPQKPE